MQAADQVGPKILFDLSQVETGFPVRYLHYGLESKARVRHPGIHLPKSDSGKYTIQARVSAAHPGRCTRIFRMPRVRPSALPGLACSTRHIGCDKPKRHHIIRVTTITVEVVRCAHYYCEPRLPHLHKPSTYSNVS